MNNEEICENCNGTGWEGCCNDHSASTEHPFCSCGEHAGKCQECDKGVKL